MSEAILREDWLIQVERAFKKLKTANTAERNEYCEVIREDWGRDAEAELKARLTAHDQATIKPTAVVVHRRLGAFKPEPQPAEPEPVASAEPEAKAEPRVMLPAVVPTPPLPATWDDAIEA